MPRRISFYAPLGHGNTGAMSIAEYPLRWRRFRAAPSLSRETRKRLRYMEFYLAHGRHVRLTCRHFGISTDHLLPVVAPLRSRGGSRVWRTIATRGGRGGSASPRCGPCACAPPPGPPLQFTSATDTGLGAATIAVDDHTPARPSDTPDTAISQDRDVHRDLLSFDIHVHGHYFLW